MSPSDNNQNNSDIDTHLEEVKNNFKALNTSLYNLSKGSLYGISDFVGQFNDFTKEIFEDDLWKDNNWGLENWNFNRNFNHWNHKWVWDNYKSGDLDPESRKWNPFPSILNYLVAAKFGLASYGPPSLRQYNKCLDKQGQQLYDSNGVWRCLFPNAEISNRLLERKNSKFPEEIFTKEDFESQVSAQGAEWKSGKIDLGQKGVFFKLFEDLLNWQSAMEKNVKQHRSLCNEHKAQCKDRKAQWKEDRLAVQSDPVSESNANKKVVSLSVELNYDYFDGNLVYKETRTEVYSDGTSHTTTMTKSKGPGEEWKLETNDKNGWFWKG